MSGDAGTASTAAKAKRTNLVMTVRQILNSKDFKPSQLNSRLNSLYDIPTERPQPPAGCDWPPDDKTQEWIQIALDVEMRDRFFKSFSEQKPGLVFQFSNYERREALAILELRAMAPPLA
jgi:hypothetical protein